MKTTYITFDLETIPQIDNLHLMGEFQKRIDAGKNESLQEAGLNPCFGMIVHACFKVNDDTTPVHISVEHDNIHEYDKKLCRSAALFLSGLEHGLGHDYKIVFVGHALLTFDLPFLAKRIIANGITLPNCLKVFGKKPWELDHIDTMVIAKHSGMTNHRLHDLCLMLGIQSPKDACQCNGGDVFEMYENNQFADIGRYCEADVNATYLIWQKFKQLNFI